MTSRSTARLRTVDEQLSLPLAWLDEPGMLAALRARGAVRLERVRFKRNRSRMISLSADHRSLNLQECFRSAPSDVLDAVACFVRAPGANVEFRRAVRRMRSWWDGQEGDAAPGPSRRANSCGTAEQDAWLRALYGNLNARFFGSALPADVPLRLSDRMSRRFGHILYSRRDGRSGVSEIAINIDLFLRGNERHLMDTMLHEMAHAEAWLLQGHRGHGAVWRAIAERVGCEPRGWSGVRIKRRGRNAGPVTDVPRLLLETATP